MLTDVARTHFTGRIRPIVAESTTGSPYSTGLNKVPAVIDVGKPIWTTRGPSLATDAPQNGGYTNLLEQKNEALGNRNQARVILPTPGGNAIYLMKKVGGRRAPLF
jgi:hypothetical protein